MIPRATFIDIGCGEGRVLLMAAEHGFRKIIGIDLAADLCLTARGNVERYRRCSNSSALSALNREMYIRHSQPARRALSFTTRLMNP